MAWPAKLSRDPLIHFLLIGAVIFLAYALLGNQQVAPRDRIVVTEGRLQQLSNAFVSTRQRAPTAEELRALVDAFIKEEIYYREAVRLGLDRDDTLIRRRMQQKLEFLIEPDEESLAASDAELEAFLLSNRAEFAVEPQIAFQQIFIRTDRETSVTERVTKILDAAGEGSSFADLQNMGDPSLLPPALELTSLRHVDRTFGDGFGRQLMKLPRDAWAGPVPSSFGQHLIRITDEREGYDPPLDTVRKAVELKWRTARRDRFREAEYTRLREKYEVILPGHDPPLLAK